MCFLSETKKLHTSVMFANSQWKMLLAISISQMQVAITCMNSKYPHSIPQVALLRHDRRHAVYKWLPTWRYAWSLCKYWLPEYILLRSNLCDCYSDIGEILNKPTIQNLVSEFINIHFSTVANIEIPPMWDAQLFSKMIIRSPEGS